MRPLFFVYFSTRTCKMEIETIFTSVGVNRTPNSLDWASDGRICYGACNSIVVLSPTVSKLLENNILIMIEYKILG